MVLPLWVFGGLQFSGPRRETSACQAAHPKNTERIITSSQRRIQVHSPLEQLELHDISDYQDFNFRSTEGRGGISLAVEHNYQQPLARITDPAFLAFRVIAKQVYSEEKMCV